MVLFEAPDNQLEKFMLLTDTALVGIKRVIGVVALSIESIN